MMDYRNKWNIPDSMAGVFYLALIAISIFLVLQTIGTRIFAVEEIGHPFEKSEYTTQYYVNLFKEEHYAKNYRVKADIHVWRECDPGPDDPCWRMIYLNKAYFPNGGYLTFDDCRLEMKEKEYCKDTHDDEWYVELTDSKVE